MNIIAVGEAGFAYYKKHGDDFAKLMPKGTDPTFRADLIAFLKKHYPQYNPNGLIDDTVALIDLITAPAQAGAQPDNAPIKDASNG